MSRQELSGVLAANRLGAGGVAGFVLTAAAPMLVVGGVVTTGWAVTGTVAIGAALLLMAVVLAVWAVGYVTMARHVANAGSLYTYVARAFGPAPGVAASLAQLVAYSCMQFSLYGIGGAEAEAVVGDLTGVDLPWWFWALGAWMVVTLLGTRGVGVSSRILSIAVMCEFALIVVVAAIDLAHPAGAVTLEAIDPTRLDGGSLGVAFAIAILAFIGVEQAPAYSEESRNPRTTILIASVAALALMIGPYLLGTWAMAVGVGTDQIITTANDLGPDTLLVPASQHWGGQTLVDTGHLLLLTSVCAGMVSYHNAVTRCAFALGRETVLPRVFARTNPASGAPIGASVAQSATSLVAIVVAGLLGLDPMTQVFYILGTTGGFGVFLLMIAASVSVVRFFHADRRGESPWNTTLLPSLAALVMATIACLIVDNYATLSGLDPVGWGRWALPGLFPTAALVGVCHARWLRSRRPQVLSAVGHGANAILLSLPTTQHQGAR